MKPLLSESNDTDSLQALGRASVQIIHDLKNQINGLKLYATFLRKRLEKSPDSRDELETVEKLTSGLDRASADLSLLVEFGRPVALKKKSAVNLYELITNVVDSVNQQSRETVSVDSKIVLNSEPVDCEGDFDAVALANAFRSISIGALKLSSVKREPKSLEVSLKDDSGKDCLIEWTTIDGLDHDPFRSFVGSDEIRMSLAAKVIEAHGGSADRRNGTLSVRLPLSTPENAESKV